MFDPAAHPSQSKPSSREAAYRKLNYAANLMRLLTVVYAAFTLWQLTIWWFNKPLIIRMKGRYWGLDLIDMASWQPMVGFGLNFLAWILLVVSITYAWRFFDEFKKTAGLSPNGDELLMRCAWFAVGCFALTVLSRPVFNYFLTIHLDPALRVFDMQLQMRDLMRGILTLALLMFAYIHRWMLDIAQENAEFV